MLALATLVFALAASAFPLGLSSNSTSSRDDALTSISARTTCTDGKLICNGQTHWAICSHNTLIFQSVAAGTVCVNGAIQRAGGNPAPAAPAAAAPHPSTHAPARPSATHPAAASHAPAPASPSAHAAGPLPTGYKMHFGNGSPSEGWPTENNFGTFEALWAANQPVMAQSCSQFGQANNSPQEIAEIKSAILSIAQSSGVDARFILAIMMQESKGCSRVWSTALSVGNPGLMQSHDGSGSCNTGTSTVAGKVSNPCPASSITQMIKDGVEGTASGEGLKQTLARSGATDCSRFYRAARLYNSGSISPNGMLGQGIATHCYSSDIANRLTGRLTGGRTGCHLDPPT